MFQDERPESSQLSNLSFHTTVPDSGSFIDDIEASFPWLTNPETLVSALTAVDWPKEEFEFLERLGHSSHECIEIELKKLTAMLLPLVVSAKGAGIEQTLPTDEQERLVRNKFSLLRNTIELGISNAIAPAIGESDNVALAECLLSRFEQYQTRYQETPESTSVSAHVLSDYQLVRSYLLACVSDLHTLPDGYRRHFAEATEHHLSSFINSIQDAESGVYSLEDHTETLSLMQEVGQCAGLLSPDVDPYLLVETAELLHEMYILHNTSLEDEYVDDEPSGDDYWNTYGSEDSSPSGSLSPEHVDAYFSDLSESIEQDDMHLIQSKALMHSYLAISDALQEAPCTEDTIKHWEHLCENTTPDSPHFYQGFYGLHAIAPQRTFGYLEPLLDAMGENVDGQCLYAAFTVMGTQAGEDAFAEALSKRSVDDREYLIEQLYAVLDGFHPHCSYFHTDSLAALQRVAGNFDR